MDVTNIKEIDEHNIEVDNSKKNKTKPLEKLSQH